MLSTQNMVKGLHKVFNTVVNDILQVLPIFGESGSEVSYLITELRNFAEVSRLSENINKTWIKSILKEIKHSIKNRLF